MLPTDSLRINYNPSRSCRTCVFERIVGDPRTQANPRADHLPLWGMLGSDPGTLAAAINGSGVMQIEADQLLRPDGSYRPKALQQDGGSTELALLPGIVQSPISGHLHLISEMSELRKQIEALPNARYVLSALFDTLRVQVPQWRCHFKVSDANRVDPHQPAARCVGGDRVVRED